jgi:hypothetical protein
MREAIGYRGSGKSFYDVLKDTGKYVECNDGRKFLMECSNVIAEKIVFLRTIPIFSYTFICI